jgi:dihydropteroate synthase
MAGRPLVMGILNVTPDSFSDGGRYLDPTVAVEHAGEMVAEGADLVDVGGESTRPGAEPVDEATERSRVLPVVEALAGRVRLSIDTTTPGVARAAVAAGASLINDVSATLWPVAAELGVPWVAMHMRGTPRTMQRAPHYDDVVDEVRSFLDDVAGRALDAGVPEVWVDPGIGFGKTTRHNLELLAHLDRIVELGHPVLVGTSRKRFLGELTADGDRRVAAALAGRRRPDAPPPPPDAVAGAADGDPAPVDDRLDATVATVTWSLAHGARMVRVHDVRAAARAVRVVAA